MAASASPSTPVVTRSTVADLAAAPVANGARRGLNAGAVLRTALHHGPIARSTIARITGLSPAAVTGHCADLIRQGLLRELPGEVRSNGAGRPHLPVAVDTSRHLAASVHIAVPYTTVALLDLRGRVLARRRLPHVETDPERLVRRAAQGLADLCARHSGSARPIGLGAATGGWVDARTGTVMEHPLLPGWNRVPLRGLLGEHTGLPVSVDGHSRALLNGEMLLGRARRAASVLHVFVGNVVDAAFSTRGEAHHGSRSQAGAIAHLPVDGGGSGGIGGIGGAGGRTGERCTCGRTGCLEAAVSELTLTRRALERGIIPAPDFTLLLAAARAGNGPALELLVERARLVGRAVALLIDVFGPELAVVTEAASLHLPEVLTALRESAREHVRTVCDIDSMLTTTGFRGAVPETAGAAVLLDELYRDPLAFAD